MSRKIYTLLPLAVSEEELAVNLLQVGKEGPRGGMAVWVDDQLCVKIPLTRGKFALIDFEDYDHIGMYRWHAYQSRHVWYARRGLNIGHRKVRLFSMHDQILGAFGCIVDHRNRDGLDNRRLNIHVADRGINRQNSISTSRSGFKGVYRVPSGKWVSQLRTKAGGLNHFGTFNTDMEAAQAYDAGAISILGEGARLNFPV